MNLTTVYHDCKKLVHNFTLHSTSFLEQDNTVNWQYTNLLNMARHLKDENMQHFNSGIGLSISLFPGSIDLRKIDVIQYKSGHWTDVLLASPTNQGQKFNTHSQSQWNNVYSAQLLDLWTLLYYSHAINPLFSKQNQRTGNWQIGNWYETHFPNFPRSLIIKARR